MWPYDREIKATGWLSARDYGHATMLCRKSQLRFPYLITGLVWLAIFAVFLEAAAAYQIHTKGWSWNAVLLIAVPFIGVFFLFIHPYIRSARTVRVRKQSGIPPSIWRFSANGIDVSDTHAEHHLQWSIANKAIVTKRYVLLALGSNHYHTFAFPMFESAEDWQDFRLAMIRHFIGCRSCGYDLHGTLSDTCPECGKPIA